MHNFSPIDKVHPMTYCRFPTALIVGFFIVLLTITSCSKKSTTYSRQQESVDTKTALSIARLTDIPIPLGFLLSHQEKSAQVSTLKFQGTKTLESSKQFYCQEMDRLGWKLTDYSTPSSSILLCEKGRTSCIINITQQEKTILDLHIKKECHTKNNKSSDINSKQLDLISQG